MEALESAVLDILQTDMPNAIEAYNETITDDVVIPQVETWQQSLPPNALDFAITDLPRVLVGAYTDIPLHANPDDDVYFEMLVERPIMVAIVMNGQTGLIAHKRLSRLITVMKSVLRARIQGRMNNQCAYWPRAMKVEIDPPVGAPNNLGYISVGTLVAETVRCIDFG